MQGLVKFINKSFGTYTVRGLQIEPTYWQAAVILLLMFMLVFTIARIRYLYVHWSMGKSSISMLIWGFLLAVVLEGFLLLGGKTFTTVILGWQSAPKPISTALDMSRSKLVEVLGETEEIPQPQEPATYQSVVGSYLKLGDEDKQTARTFICE